MTKASGSNQLMGEAISELMKAVRLSTDGICF